MSAPSGVFEWIEFPEGRARFCGGVRGADQAGHEVFAVEIAGESYYGEVSSVWPDDCHFNLRIDSFGHSRIENVGMPVREGSPFIKEFPSADVELIKSLILRLIETFWRRAERPFVMEMDDVDQFRGKVEFAEGWVLVANEASSE